MSSSPSSPSSDRARVCVIGAGLAGLAAASRLRRKGLEVVTLEQRDVVGGHVTGHQLDGFTFDAMLPVVSPRDAHVLRFVHDHGATERMLPLRPVQLAQAVGTRVSPLDTSSVFGLARADGIRPLDALRVFRLHRLMRRYRPLLDPDAPDRAADLDYRSVADFARLYFGDSAFDRWIAPAVCQTAGGDENDLSRVAFLLQFVELGEAHERWALPREGWYELAQTAGEQADVRCGVTVRAVEAREGGGFAVHAEAEDGGATQVEADAVVVATSAAEAGRIASGLATPAERDFFAGVKTQPAMTLVAGLEDAQNGLPQLVRVPRAERSPIEAYVLEPGVADGRVPLGRGMVSIAATREFAATRANAGGDVVEKELVAALAQTVPRASGALRLTRLERREGAPSFEVGAYRELARFQRVQTDRRALGRRLYFAGDYLAGPRIQHALSSGERAAAALVGDFA